MITIVEGVGGKEGKTKDNETPDWTHTHTELHCWGRWWLWISQKKPCKQSRDAKLCFWQTVLLPTVRKKICKSKEEDNIRLPVCVCVCASIQVYVNVCTHSGKGEMVKKVMAVAELDRRESEKTCKCEESWKRERGWRQWKVEGHGKGSASAAEKDCLCC